MSIRRNSHIQMIKGALITTPLLVVALVAATKASAAYEQVATFAEHGKEGAQALRLARSTAVNIAGKGGATPGTVYVSNSCEIGCGDEGHTNVMTFTSNGEFIAKLPIERSSYAIAVDQSTGNLFVLQSANPGQSAIHEYSPDGTQNLANFGEQGGHGEEASRSPEKLHTERMPGSALAVGPEGDVYVADVNAGENGRVMAFEEASPGNWVYAGASHDIAKGREVVQIGFDEAGNFYGLSQQAIYEFSPGSATPICELRAPTGSVGFATVDARGGVFYRVNRESIRQVVCGSAGRFEEVGKSVPTPQFGQGTDVPLAFNPSLRWPGGKPGGERAVGTLYAIDQLETAPDNARGYIFAPAEASPPAVLAESVSHVKSTSAVLNASVNPHGHPSEYVFEYLTDAQFNANPPATPFAGAIRAPVGGGTLPGETSALAVSSAIPGLTPGTSYRYRVVAVSHCEPNPSIVCEAAGVPRVFSTYPPLSAGLPDGRGYELVSPAGKRGGEVSPLYPEFGSCSKPCKPSGGKGGFPVLSSTDGESILYRGQPFFTTEGPPTTNQYLARRGPSGWVSATVSPTLQENVGYEAFDQGLSAGVIAQGPTVLDSAGPAGYPNLYIEDTILPLGPPRPLITGTPTLAPGVFAPYYAGSATDLSRVFFAANDALTTGTSVAPAAAPPGQVEGPGGVKLGASNLYEWTGNGLALVNVLPGNTAAVPAGAEFGYGTRTISTDGRRAFWNDGENGNVYVRVDGSETEEIPGKGNCHIVPRLPEVSSGACFVTASADGSRVLLGEGELFALSAGGTAYEPIATLGGAGRFLGIAGQSEDLSTLYFVDTGVIPGAEENSDGVRALAGQPNLYRWTSGSQTFIGTLSPSYISLGGEENDISTWSLRPSNRAAESSPDGRWLAFLTKRSINGADISGDCEENECPQAYVYDSATNSLQCVSCSPAGETSLGETRLPLMQQGPNGGVNSNGLAQPYYVTNAGRVYFDTQNALSPIDTNAGVEDVYEFEPYGVGTCGRAAGCVGLISAGTGSSDSNFAAIEPSGGNVFFTTRDRLVPRDKDELIDLYDAREGGGFASERESSPGECLGEACQPTGLPPAEPTPASQGIVGSPPTKPASCKKGKVKRKGHCVRRQPKKHQRKNNQHGHKSKKAKRAPSAKGGSK